MSRIVSSYLDECNNEVVPTGSHSGLHSDRKFDADAWGQLIGIIELGQLEVVVFGTLVLFGDSSPQESPYLSVNADNKVKVAAAGAIPPLVALLGSGTSAAVQMAAAIALGNLSANNADSQVMVAAAGAIPPLVALRDNGSTQAVKDLAKGALIALRA